MRRLSEAGLVDKYYIEEMNKVAILNKDSASSTIIKLTPNHLQGAFLLYGFVLAFGILSFSIELCVNARKKRKQSI